MPASLLSYRKAASALLVLALAVAVVVTGFPTPQKAQAAYVDPANYVIGLQTPARITKLIYPTIGNAAIVQKGTSFAIEYDPREGHFYPDVFPTGATNFAVTVTTTNGGAGGIARALPVTSATAGYSTRWPSLKYSATVDRRIYLVTVLVPYSLPADLYDVTISCVIEGNSYPDTQTNSLSVVNSFKTKFNFIQMSDIHVYGPENPDAAFFYSHSRHERGQRRTTWDPNVGFGATYLHKQIQEINRMHPDFCVLTGDYDFGQRYWYQTNGQRGYGSWGDRTQYEFEQEWFYQEIQRFEVPVFIVMGNHDGYEYNTDMGAPVNQDWFTNWTHLYGPLYFAFEYGSEARFFMINTMDWMPDQRTLINYLDLILQPVKYMGAGTSGGDNWQAGCSQARLNAINVSGLTAQLGWLRDALAASQGYKARVCAMHHDPWKADGSGSMWQSGGDGDWLSQIEGGLDMGNGPGRLAYIRLMKDYRVQLMVHGHDHSDCTSTDDSQKTLLNWSSGSGQVISQNTTSTAFQGDGDSSEYPGYRRVWINNGSVIQSGNEDLNYTDPYWSWPAYANTNVGGTTDLGSLTIPAVEQLWSATPGPGTEDVTCTLDNNYTAKPLSGMYMEFPMKYLSGNYYYLVSNGTLGETFDVSGAVRMNQVYTDLTTHQLDKAVRVYKSPAPDTSIPTGTALINGGADSTTSANVTLALQASDPQSGVGEMRISNSPGFEGAEWEKYTTSRSWTLSAGAGEKAVYVQFRDRSMPGNVLTTGDTINFYEQQGTGPRIVSVDPNSHEVGGAQFTVLVTGEGTSFVNGMGITFTRPNGRASGITVYSTTVLGPTSCRALVSIDTGAPGGYVDVGAVGAGDVAPLQGGFHVLGPEIISVNPASSYGGTTLDITVRGSLTGFVTGVSHIKFYRNGTLVEPTDIKENSTTVVSGQEVVANVTIDQYCPPGLYDVNVVTVSEVPGELINGFRVNADTRTWYLAEGCTNGGIDTWILVQNPGDTDAHVTYSYMTNEGPKAGPTVTLPKQSRQTIYAADVVPGTWDVSAKVTSDQPVIVERSMYGNNKAWGTDSIGVTTPYRTWYLAEGCTNGGFQTWILLLNPTEVDATVQLSYMTDAGPVAGPSVPVAKQSRKSINVADSVPNTWSVSTRVDSDVPIIAERSMYGGNTGAGNVWGHNSLGVTAPAFQWYLAEGCTNGGMESWVLVQNPGETDANAALTYMTPEGQVTGPGLVVKAHTRQTVNVADTVPGNWSVSTKVTSDQPVIAERAMYGGGRAWGTDSVGINAAAPTWYLAEGSTRGGMETWVLVQNPGSADATVALSYMTDTGPVTGPTITLKAHTRESLNVADVAPEVWSVSTKVTATQQICVERAVYGNGRSWATDSIGYTL